MTSSSTRSDSDSWLQKNKLVVKETIEAGWEFADFTHLKDLIRMPNKKSRGYPFEFVLDVTNKEKNGRVYLEFSPSSCQLSVRYRVILGADHRHPIHSEHIYYSDPPFRDSGITSYCYEDIKKSSIHMGNGIRNLTIDIEVDILEPAPKGRIHLPDTAEIQGHVLKNYQALLETGDHYDFVLSVNGKEFRVHKAILAAQSEVFKAMFAFNTNKFEKTNYRTEIADIDMDVFEALLYYMYGGKIANLKDMALELMIASDKYQLKQLKSICERSQCLSLTIESVVNAYVIADMHQAALLKAECIAFIGANSAAVKQTESWKMMISRPDLLMELFEKLSIKST